MPPPSVVKHLYIIEYITACFFPSCVDMTPNSLALQKLEEALGNRIVVAVSSSAHTPFQAMFPQETLPVVTGVLATLVRMHHHLCFGVSPPYRHHLIQFSNSIFEPLNGGVSFFIQPNRGFRARMSVNAWFIDGLNRSDDKLR